MAQDRIIEKEEEMLLIVAQIKVEHKAVKKQLQMEDKNDYLYGEVNQVER